MKMNMDESVKGSLVLANLKLSGITTIIIEFSGGGDSGSIDDIIYYKDDTIVRISDSNTREVIESIADSLLEEAPDYINNEGGHGNIELNLLDNTYKTTVNIRVVDYDCYDYSGTITDNIW